MGLFTWIFGKQITPAQLVRRNQRAITKAMRNLDRERFHMEQQEKKLIIDIKKTAKAGQMDAVKIMATDLVRTRAYIKKFMIMKANLQAVSVKMLTLQSQHAIGEAMRGVTLALRGINLYEDISVLKAFRRLRLPQVQRILQEFEKQTQLMDLKEEMMNETMDDSLGVEDQETESDELVAQIFDELGLQLQDQLPELPGARGFKEATKVPASAADTNVNEIDDDLQTRLDNLRRD